MDAIVVPQPSLPLLARVMRIRRELRAAGGDLVLAANTEVVALLRSSGLHGTVPCRGDVVSAVAALEASRPRLG